MHRCEQRCMIAPMKWLTLCSIILGRAAMLGAQTPAPTPSKSATPASSDKPKPAAKPSAPTPAPIAATKPAPSTKPVASDDPYAQIVLLTQAMEKIRAEYVDPSKVTYEDLIEGALEGMLHKLDPHCEYMGKQLFEDMQREQSDSSEGVGITISMRQNALTIITVREDGPAAKAGVLAGDQIVRIKDVLADNIGVAESIRLLKGKAGEAIRLTVRRPGTKQFLDFNVVRETLHDSSVHDAMLIHDKLATGYKIGYARVEQFTQATVKDLSIALDKLEAEGMKAFILDLRNNPGGLLDSSIALCGEFLPEDTVVVTTEGRVGAENAPPYRTPKRKGKAPRTYPMAVLINQGSASAAEITAGVMQDLRRALIVGTTSFGKGSVQTIFPMENGTAMRLTTAKYYTPSHRTIHEHGVTPNIVSAITTEDEMKIARWRSNHGTGEAAALELANLGDNQLERAVDAMKGVLVFKDFNSAPPSPTPLKSDVIERLAPKVDALKVEPKVKIEEPAVP
jgi:carboxyl-terminal processing protease